jgi:predicted XRE-type DNA-binding protein
VWDAIDNAPAEAGSIKLRSALMMALEQNITRQGWIQDEAARQLSVMQPRQTDQMRGGITLF